MKSYTRIKARATREINRGSTESPCAALILRLRSAFGIDEDEQVSSIAQALANDDSLFGNHNKIVKSMVFLLNDPRSARRILRRAKSEWETLLSLEELAKTGSTFYDLLARVSWPGYVSEVSDEFIESLSRTREPNESADDGNYLGQFGSKGGRFHSEKLSRDVLFESKLEERFLKQIDRSPQVLTYQEQPFAIDVKRQSRNYSYHPDVVVVLASRRAFVVEIKPQFVMPLDVNMIRYQCLWSFCQSRGYGMLITDGRIDIAQLREPEPPADFTKAVMTELEEGGLDWNSYRDLAEKYAAGIDDFHALVLQQKLVWSLRPFRLQKSKRPSK